ncbi:hypothetical protein V3C99_002459 [Haemonchus contortus]
MNVRFSDYVSTTRKVTSGVPQGGILSPLLFLIYTHDLVACLQADSRLHVAAYADDVKVSIAFHAQDQDEARGLLNKAVENMCNWCSRWGLNVNRRKCHLFSLGAVRLDVRFPDGTPVAPSLKVKDLGVNLSAGLKWSCHIDEISTKGLKLVHLLFRNIHTSETAVWIRLYKMYVLPIVEYCSPVWSPYLVKDIQKIEKVQKSFTRILYYRAFPSVDYPRSLPDYRTRLRVLNLKSLFQRRVEADLVLAFKLLKGELRLKPSQFWIFRPSHGRRGTFNVFNHKMGNRCRELRANSYIIRTTKWLQSLPSHLLAFDNSAQFKKAVAKSNILSLFGIADVS